jgi:hypothetical protein
VAPWRKNLKEEIAYDKEKHRKRSFIERIFGKAKENRRFTAGVCPKVCGIGQPEVELPKVDGHK